MDYLTYLRNFGYGEPNYMMSPGMVIPDKGIETSLWPLEFQSKSSEAILNSAVAGVKNSVGSEKEDELFYDTLISKTPNSDQKEIIESIRNDERNHNKIFRKIFAELTGTVIPTNMDQKVSMPDSNTSYIENLKKAFFGELNAIKKYREIAAYMPNKELYDMVIFIMTDEIRHASLYNYLMLLNMTAS